MKLFSKKRWKWDFRKKVMLILVVALFFASFFATTDARWATADFESKPKQPGESHLSVATICILAGNHFIAGTYSKQGDTWVSEEDQIVTPFERHLVIRKSGKIYGVCLNHKSIFDCSRWILWTIQGWSIHSLLISGGKCTFTTHEIDPPDYTINFHGPFEEIVSSTTPVEHNMMRGVNRSGHYAQGALFGENNGYIELSNSLFRGKEGFTISILAEIRSSILRGCLLGCNSRKCPELCFYRRNIETYLSSVHGIDLGVSNATIRDRFLSIVWSKNGTEQSLMVDGVVIAHSNPAPREFDVSGPMFLGQSGGSLFFHGNVDSIRFWRRGMSPNEMLQVSSDDRAPDEPFTMNWTVGAWSACSKTCGGGISTRDVRCTSPAGDIDISNCALPMPSTQMVCDEQPCNGTCVARRKVNGKPERLEDPKEICMRQGLGRAKCFVQAEEGVFHCTGEKSCCISGRCAPCAEAYAKRNEQKSDAWFALSTPDDPEMTTDEGVPKLIIRSVFIDPVHESRIQVVILAEIHNTWKDRTFICGEPFWGAAEGKAHLLRVNEEIVKSNPVEWLFVRIVCRFRDKLKGKVLSVPNSLELLISREDNEPFTQEFAELSNSKNRLGLMRTVTKVAPKVKRHLGACVGVLHGTPNQNLDPTSTPRDILYAWFMYHHREMGIDFFHVYYVPESLDPEIMIVLESLPFIDLQPWIQKHNIPFGVDERQVFGFSQPLAYHDCVFRNRLDYDWLIFLDTDDWVATSEPLPNLIEAHSTESTGIIRFPWFEYIPQCGDLGAHIIPLWKRFTAHTKGPRGSKYLMRPHVCDEPESHTATKCQNSFSTKWIPTTIGHVAHFFRRKLWYNELDLPQRSADGKWTGDEQVLCETHLVHDIVVETDYDLRPFQEEHNQIFTEPMIS